MPRLHRDNTRRRRKHIRATDQRRSAEVRAHADGFEDAGGGHHGRCVGEGGLEVVDAGFDGFGAGGGDDAEECGDVRCFCFADLLEGGDVVLCEAEGEEVRGGEFGEAFFVEGGFEVFGCEGAGESVSNSVCV